MKSKNFQRGETTLQQKKFQRRKFCRFCSEKAEYIDYKDLKVLRNYLTERGKIFPRRMTGTCARHQKNLNEAIKRARNIALLSFAEK
ncbi:MAG: 30S ribosomal protein S18 [Nitrospirota bacterium]